MEHNRRGDQGSTEQEYTGYDPEIQDEPIFDDPQMMGGSQQLRISEEVACHFRDASEVVRDAAQRLGGRSARVGQAANWLANSLNNAGRYVETAHTRDIIRDAAAFARRRPDLFLGGAVVAGLIVGRFLRSDEPHRQDTSDTTDQVPQQSFSEAQGVVYGD